MAKLSFSVLILAAGQSTRFKSDRSKMVHSLAGRPLGDYLLSASLAAGPDRVFVIVRHDGDEIREVLGRPGVTFLEQKEQLGTGHAVKVARPELEKCKSKALIVLVGDAPLLASETLGTLLKTHQKAGAAATILTATVENPQGYGRIVRFGRIPSNRSADRVRAIVEERILMPSQQKIKEISSGVICFSRTSLMKHLDEITAENAQKEYLLTDMIEILNRHHEKVIAFRLQDAREVLGVNDRIDLARLEKILRRRKAEALMREGVTIVDPEATYIDDAVEVGRDTIIEPGVSLLGRTRLGKGCTIRVHSTIVDSTLGENVLVRPYCMISSAAVGSGVMFGPFAHVRDGARIDTDARIGNFVEVKNSHIGRGTKSQHLTYLGDARVGEKVNVGAGTVTCNYDGAHKYPTIIEDAVFIGSGSMLVAPVRVGKGAYVAAGSTITEDVPPEALALGRARQVTKEGWMREKAAKNRTATGK